MNEPESCYGQEIELKLRVPSAEALRAIATASGGASLGAVQQRNWLFDTADHRLQQARFAVRVRDESGQFSVTAKAPETLDADGVIASRAEAETEIMRETADRLLDGSACPLDSHRTSGPECAALVQRVRAVLDGAPMRVIGSFDNVRDRWGVQIPGVGSLVLELDTTTFPNGQVDHELELEMPEGTNADLVRRAIDSWLISAGVAASPSSSKAGRFYAALPRS